MSQTFVYKSKKVVDGVKLSGSRLMEMIDCWDFWDDDGDCPYTYSNAEDTVEVLVGGKKIPLNKVIFVLRNPEDFDPES